MNIINNPLYLSSVVSVKVGHITCDNASNNLTMMKELAACLNTKMGKTYISLEEAETSANLGSAVWHWTALDSAIVP